MKKAIIVIVIIAVFVLGGWYLFARPGIEISDSDENRNATQVNKIQEEIKTNQNLNKNSQVTIPTDWKTLESENYDYTIFFSPKLVL